MTSDLPHPDSQELRELVPEPAIRILYRVLYEHRDDGITMQDLRRLASPLLKAIGASDAQEQLDRRKRTLHEQFRVVVERVGRDNRHRLVGRLAAPRERRAAISGRVRAAVLKAARCAMCGRTPLEDGIKLAVDHKVPLEWGGTNGAENLQPLCEECNSGKKAHFAEYDEHSGQIRRAANHAEPQKRIGELLKAFDGGWVSDDLLEVVANAKEHQADWHRRLRELRDLGWRIETRRKKEGRRVRTYYRAAQWREWPPGPLRTYIKG